MREPDASVSIFDDDAFLFYLIKYGEILGLDALLIASSTDRKMSYDQKRKIIEFIIEMEADLNVAESSWKHCLIFLVHNGTISRKELKNMLTNAEEL